MSEANGMVHVTPQAHTSAGTLRDGAMAVAAQSPAQDLVSHRHERSRATGTPDWYLYGLAAVIVLGFFALTVTMILHDIPQNSQNIAYMLLGGLVTGFSMVLSYFFGSSAGSAHKTAQLAELMKQGAPKL